MQHHLCIHDINGRPDDKAVSYSGHAKASVFSSWQKALQNQEYEACCHWAAEIDCSHWQGQLWEKLVVHASKHVHLNCPKLPLLLCKHIATFDEYPPQEARNKAVLRSNLCQSIGIVCTTPKAVALALPSLLGCMGPVPGLVAAARAAAASAAGRRPRDFDSPL